MPNRFDASRFRVSSNLSNNLNVTWINSRGALAGYLFLIFGVFYLLCLLVPLDDAATIVNVIHFVVAFYLFHWVKGSPTGDQGEYNDKTTWEQMDDGIPRTEAKKVLMITPIVMWIIGSHLNDYSLNYFLLTAVPLGFQIFPKLPEFNGVRLFGLNKFQE